VRLSVERIVVRGAGERVDPRTLRSSIDRELARSLEPGRRPRGRKALAAGVSDAVRTAVEGEGR
jgi:hypothetical protein